ncbi:MAG: hypothetical protein ACTS8Z_03465, partial [Candidatus Limnocylindrales bacterium]
SPRGALTAESNAASLLKGFGGGGATCGGVSGAGGVRLEKCRAVRDGTHAGWIRLRACQTAGPA